MLILRHNTLSSQDLFTIECLMVKVTDPKYEVSDLTHFKVLDKTRAELYGFILGFCERLGLCESIGVTPSEFLDFMIDVDKGYLENAYHSFFHAVDVAIVLYHMISKYDIANYISRIDIAALMIAGLCHDIGHPGMNNNYQVNLKTDLANRYRNKSVLESYSCTITMDLLTKHKLLKNINSASQVLGLPTTEPELRTNIIKMILATDMIFHYELQENLANLLEIINDPNHTNNNQYQHSHPHHHSSQRCRNSKLDSTLEEEEEEEEEDEGEREEGQFAQQLPDAALTYSPPQNYADHEIQVKDIFETQGAKSAISYFRKKSYFEEDMIRLIKILPLSPKEENSNNLEANQKNRYSESYSGVDLVTNTIKDRDGIERVVNTPPHFINDPQQRLILCQIVLHAADISNALRPWPICLTWSNLVCEEFFCQGDAERQNGLQISPNMDRDQVQQTTIGLRFGDFVVSPYFEIVAALFPKADELLKNLAENRLQWLRMEEALVQDSHEATDQVNNERLPLNMLPDRPILNPPGRRVSVAAGMVVIPDDLEERTIGSGKNKRKYWGVRSVSHSDILFQDQKDHIVRRRSDEPSLAMSRRLKFISMSSTGREKKKQKSLTNQ